MDKKSALKILIQHSFLLSEDVKKTLYYKLDEMTNAQIGMLGRLLALEKKKSLELNPEKIKALENIIKRLDQSNKTQL